MNIPNGIRIISIDILIFSQFYQDMTGELIRNAES